MVQIRKPSTGGPAVPESFTQAVHDQEDHTGLTGIIEGTNYKGPLNSLVDLYALTEIEDCAIYYIRTENNFYRWNTEDFATPTWVIVGSAEGSWSSLNNTIDASSWRNITVANVFPALITKIAISAIDGAATPDIEYDIEIYNEAEMTSYAYVARAIKAPSFEDLVPWEYFGATTMYIKVINKKAAAITDLDIVINYRK